MSSSVWRVLSQFENGCLTSTFTNVGRYVLTSHNHTMTIQLICFFFMIFNILYYCFIIPYGKYIFDEQNPEIFRKQK